MTSKRGIIALIVGVLIVGICLGMAGANISRRDYFAGQALSGLVGGNPWMYITKLPLHMPPEENRDALVRAAYLIADEMLKEKGDDTE